MVRLRLAKFRLKKLWGVLVLAVSGILLMQGLDILFSTTWTKLFFIYNSAILLMWLYDSFTDFNKKYKAEIHQIIAEG